MIRVKSKTYIDKISPYIGGKSIIDNSSQIIKLSSNENALGASNNITFLKDKIYRYPDGSCFDLRNVISNKYNIDIDNIVCGAGSDEIISFLAYGFAGEGDEIIHSEYGFLMYPICAKKVGAKSIIAKEVNLKTNINNIISAITNKTKIIFIANPNNPTGSYITIQEFDKLIENVPKNILIIMDLAYAEFVDRNNYPNIIDYVKKYDNIVMTRTFSKIYGLASLRIGWSFSSKYIADILNKVRGPFNVSTIAQNSAIESMKDDNFLKKSQNHNRIEMNFIENKLKEIGIKFYQSIGNFILIDFLSKNNCQIINKNLLNNGIILRDMKSYKLPNCLRMTIGTRSENEKVINIIKLLTS